MNNINQKKGLLNKLENFSYKTTIIESIIFYIFYLVAGFFCSIMATQALGFFYTPLILIFEKEVALKIIFWFTVIFSRAIYLWLSFTILSAKCLLKNKYLFILALSPILSIFLGGIFLAAIPPSILTYITPGMPSLPVDKPYKNTNTNN